MITKNPYGTYRIIKPGCLPEPLKPIHTCDPPGAMAICLSCPLPDCNPKSHSCPLRGAHGEERGRPLKNPELDRKIREMLRNGWADAALCRELKISAAELRRAKKRM